MTAVTTTPARKAQRRTTLSRLQTRSWLVVYGLLAALLALLVIAQASSAYQTTYNLFQQIAVTNSTKVTAAEAALQRIANTSQATADYTALTSDTPLFEAAQNNIFRNFQAYRDQMFILESNLQNQEERQAFTVADTYTYSQFWRHVSDLMSQRSDLDVARQQYLFADDQLRTRIVPALQDLEAVNFNELVNAGQSATATINGQVVILAVLAIGLAIGLTALSFWLRGRVRRYVTPGLDLAMILSWVVILLMVSNLLSLPGQLQRMTHDAYYSISGASRVQVIADQADRAESSAVIDPERKDSWYQQFDDDMKSVELRLCGEVGCTKQSFLAPGTTDTPNPNVVSEARSISPADATAISGADFQTGQGLVSGGASTIGENSVLMGNVTFPGEAAALEKARLAYVDYVNADATLRQKIDAGDTAGATDFNTDTTTPGTSEEAFNRFTTAMNDLGTINRSVFDSIWNDQRVSLPRNQVLFGVIGYLLVIGLIGFGVYHRYQEL